MLGLVETFTTTSCVIYTWPVLCTVRSRPMVKTPYTCTGHDATQYGVVQIVVQTVVLQTVWAREQHIVFRAACNCGAPVQLNNGTHTIASDSCCTTVPVPGMHCYTGHARHATRHSPPCECLIAVCPWHGAGVWDHGQRQFSDMYNLSDLKGTCQLNLTTMVTNEQNRVGQRSFGCKEKGNFRS